MKARRVMVMVELETDASIKKVKEWYRTVRGSYWCEPLLSAEVIQVQANVIKAGKEGKA